MKQENKKKGNLNFFKCINFRASPPADGEMNPVWRTWCAPPTHKAPPLNQAPTRRRPNFKLQCKFLISMLLTRVTYIGDMEAAMPEKQAIKQQHLPAKQSELHTDKLFSYFQAPNSVSCRRRSNISDRANSSVAREVWRVQLP